jgi:hypothetical protein
MIVPSRYPMVGQIPGFVSRHCRFSNRMFMSRPSGVSRLGGTIQRSRPHTSVEQQISPVRRVTLRFAAPIEMTIISFVSETPH